jgi:hypothetical protein
MTSVANEQERKKVDKLLKGIPLSNYKVNAFSKTAVVPELPH